MQTMVIKNAFYPYLLYPLNTVAYEPSPNCSSLMYASDFPNGESPCNIIIHY